jgi:tetratricopeptide (TPR) repeat protein
VRSHPQWLLRWLVLCALVLSAFPVAFASDTQWIEVRSPHFSVVTDAGERRGRETAMRFEQMRAVFGALLTKANVNIPVPLQIVAFRNSKEIRQVAPLWNGKPVQLAGQFLGGEDRNFIMLDMSTENPWVVVFHEYAHQLMNGVLTARVDPWFEEGFAEYFSSIEVDGKEARVGKIPNYEYLILQQNGMMKVSDLFRVRQNSPTYNESGNHRTVFYAESGIVVHYLYDNSLIPRLSQYFALKIDQNVPVEEAIQKSLGMSAADFDKVLRNYVSKGQYKYFPMQTPANIVSREYVTRPLNQADSSAVLADIHLHSPDYHGQAIAEFQEILKTNPDNAAACRGLGYAYLQQKDFSQATSYFRRAVQADPNDPRAHYYYALMMSRGGAFTDHADLAEMIKHLETAIALDPNFADPYSLLAFAQMSAGNPPKGLVSMQKAVSLSPRNERYQFNLAEMYLNNRQADPAMAILERLARTGSPEVAARAGETLQQGLPFRAAIGEPRPVEQGNDETDRADAPTRTKTNPAAEEQVGDITNRTPSRYLKGTIVSVDCSSPPVATLTVISGGRDWKMQVPDSQHVVLIGAEAFSCSWNTQKVALNYQETGVGTGRVVSIEVH